MRQRSAGFRNAVALTFTDDTRPFTMRSQGFYRTLDHAIARALGSAAYWLRQRGERIDQVVLTIEDESAQSVWTLTIPVVIR